MQNRLKLPDANQKHIYANDKDIKEWIDDYLLVLGLQHQDSIDIKMFIVNYVN